MASPIGLPQPPQNLAVGSFSKPQAGQGDGSGAPHWAQKRLCRRVFGRAAWAAHMVPRGEPILLKHNSSAIALEAKGSPEPDELVQGAGAPRGRSGAALAGVLGVRAEDLLVRERAGSQPPRHGQYGPQPPPQ